MSVFEVTVALQFAEFLKNGCLYPLQALDKPSPTSVGLSMVLDISCYATSIPY